MAPISATGESDRSASQGFTLLELMLVIAIVALLAASLPWVVNRWSPARRMTVATQRLITDVRWLQAHAIANGRTGLVQITASGYVLHIPEAGLQRSVGLPTSVRITWKSGHAAQLKIYPEGTTSGGRLDISDGRRHQTVEVSAMTGKVRLAEPLP